MEATANIQCACKNGLAIIVEAASEIKIAGECELAVIAEIAAVFNFAVSAQHEIAAVEYIALVNGHIVVNVKVNAGVNIYAYAFIDRQHIDGDVVYKLYDIAANGICIGIHKVACGIVLNVAGK